QGRAMVENMLKAGFQPEEVAEKVLNAVLTDTFYIIPAQDYMLTTIKARFDNIVSQTNPAVGGFLS
ncbi:MAG TPA: hypothetical protein PKD27_08200, partial [Tepidiformaceae bacterium]|nr:hypothetical protein [Tepidiformaceae bacterium]